MLVIFKNIRRFLLKQNKVRSYLLYAIGEIFLVVIGILIALQVNNWNEQRKTQTFESEILLLIDQNLQKDSTLIATELLKAEKANELTDSLLVQVAQNHYGERLNQWMGKIISFERFKSQSSAFEVLKAKGMESISNKELQLAMISYYDEDLFNVSESLNDVMVSFNNDWVPIIKTNFSDFKWTEYCIPVDSKEFFQKPSTIVLFKLYKDNRAGEIQEMGGALAKISEIRGLIKKDLK